MAVIFALLLIPLVLLMGAGVDVARVYSARDQVQYALDSAAIAGIRAADSQGREAAIRAYFEENLRSSHAHFHLGQLGVAVSPDGQRIYVRARIRMPLYFLRIVGMREQRLVVETSVRAAP